METKVKIEDELTIIDCPRPVVLLRDCLKAEAIRKLQLKHEISVNAKANPTCDVCFEIFKTIKGHDAEIENESHPSENELSQEEGAHALVPATSSADGNNVESSNSCTGECKWEKKYKNLKKLYVQLSLHHSELDMKFKALSKTATSDVHSDSDIDAIASNNNIFTLSEIKNLQRIPLDKTKDSSFILQCIRYAYKETPSILKNKTLKGTMPWTEIKEDGNDVHHPGKDPLTPKKVKVIKELFIARLSRSKTNSVDYSERVKELNLNKLFASAVRNVVKTQK